MFNNIPFVIEKTAHGERSCDIYSRLLKDRIVFISGAIDDQLAGAVIAQLLYLQIENKDNDISMYIMSPGGSVSAGLAIYDTMQQLTNDVATYCVGSACSMGAFLLAAGEKGKRFSLPAARIMIHQPWGGAQGTASDIEITSNEIKRLKVMLNERLAKHTGKAVSRIVQDTERDFWMSADEAKKYGIVDKVI